MAHKLKYILPKQPLSSRQKAKNPLFDLEGRIPDKKRPRDGLVALTTKLLMEPYLKKTLRYGILPLFFVTLAYQTLLHPRVFESLLIGAVSKATNARLRARVLRSSLIYGFEITDIRLELKKSRRNRPGISKSLPLLTMERFRLSWFLPSMLAGHIGIRELHLKSPHIYLERSGGRWNWERAFPATKTKKPESKDQSHLPRAIELFTGFRAYLNIRIENFAITLEDHPLPNTGKSPWSLQASGLNLQFGMLTHPFREIPLDASILSLFRTTILAVNPFHPITVRYTGRQRIEGPLKLRLLLFQESGEQGLGKKEFALHLGLDTQKLVFFDKTGRLNGTAGLHLNLDSAFDAEHDRLLVHRLELGHGPHRWLFMQARLEDLSVPERRLELRFEKSKIALDRIDRLLAILTNAPPGSSLLRGNIWIEPILVSGRLDQLNIEGGIRAAQVLIRADTQHSLEDLALSWQGRLDLYHNLPDRLRPADYDASQRPAFGILHFLNIPKLKISYNRGRLSGHASIDAKKGLRSELSIENVDWSRYFPEFMQGVSHARLSIQAPESFRFVDFTAKIHLLRGRYFLGRSRSGYQNVELSGNGRVNLKKTVSLKLNKVRLLLNSITGQQLLALKGQANLSFGNTQDYLIHLESLRIHYNRLQKLLPGSIRDQLRPAALYLSGGLQLRSRTRLQLTSANTLIRGQTFVNIPYLRLKDLALNYDLNLQDKKISIKKLNVKGLKGALGGSLAGVLAKNQKNEYTPNLELQLRLAQEEFLQVHENISMQGFLDLAFRLKDDKLNGRLQIRRLNLAYYTGRCASLRQPECHRWAVRGLNLDLPILHDLKPKTFSVLTKNPARQYAGAFGTEDPSNFSIQLLFASHNPQGRFQKNGFYYLGSPKSKKPGLSASLSYRNNVLLFKRLELALFKLAKTGSRKSWKSGGRIFGRDLYFNLADLKPRHMEASVMLQLKDLDLEPFLPESRSSYDGIISADVRLRISSLEKPLYHTNAYLSVYRISQEFSGFVTRIIMPAQIVAMMARNIIEIPGILLELKGGLVYSTIKVKRARIFPGILIAPGSDEIKQERMPLAQFLSRAKSEVKSLEGRDLRETNKNK